MTLMTSWTKARRAHENRAYVRELLWKREPAFASELATAEQDFPCPALSRGNTISTVITGGSGYLSRLVVDQLLTARGIPRIVVVSAFGVGDSLSRQPLLIRWMITRTNLSYTYADHNLVDTQIRNTDTDSLSTWCPRPLGDVGENRRYPIARYQGEES